MSFLLSYGTRVEVVLDKEIAVDSVQHLGPIYFVDLVIYIRLCWMQKTKTEGGRDRISGKYGKGRHLS